MPIYEFYCPACDTLFNFFSQRVDTESRPECPRCGRPRLARRPARFATLSRRSGEPGPEDEEGLEGFEGLEEDRLEAAMSAALATAPDLDSEEDPRRLAQAFRRFGEAAGLRPGARLEEMLGRLEAGEDPDALEAEMGDALGEEDSLEELFELRRQAAQRRGRRPRVDETLYFL